jgi:ElaB/YqjD/DUF883 family membrane-anchored ribosome-binding protein
MDNSPSSKSSDVAGIKASFRDDSFDSPDRSVGSPARRAVDRLSTSAHEKVDRLSGRASKLAAQIDAQTQRLAQAPARAWSYSKGSVQTHPVQAVAASVAVGFLLGWLAGGRLRRRDD